MSEEFLFKPESESNGNLVILTPQQFNNNVQSVEVVDGSGNVVATGDPQGAGKNGNRGHFRFDRPGAAFGNDVSVRVNFNDGSDPFERNIGAGGQRFEENITTGQSRSGGGQRGPGGSNVSNIGGVNTVLPGSVNFGSLQAPFVDFGSAFGFAQDVGRQNRDTFFGNLTGDQAREAALGLVDTDVQGIQNATSQLAPFIRDQGNQDTQTNINRAGTIDNFNLSRIPGFNQFNRDQVQQANTFAFAERERAVESSGLDFKNRIETVLDQLDAQTRGTLSDETNDALLTRTNQNRGADIGAASGVSGRSSAGINIQDRLDIDQRLGLMQDAQRLLPSVLGQGQAVLQAQEERAPTLFGQPTNVPLNTSNIADQIPVTSNISAGAAQQRIASEATNLEVIPVTTALSSNLQTQQFNEQSGFARDLTVLEGEQGAIAATDQAVQGAFNAGVANEIRQEQNDFFQQGLDQRENAQNIGALGQIFGAIGGFSSSGGTGQSGSSGGSSGQGGNSLVSNLVSGAGDVLGAATQGVSSAVGAVASGLDGLFGDGNGSLDIGNTSIDSDSFSNLVQGASDFFTGQDSELGTPQQVNGQNVVAGQTNASTGESEFILDNGDVVPQSQVTSESSGALGLVEAFTKPFQDLGADANTVSLAANAATNWGNLNAGQQIATSGTLATDVLENKGVISGENAQQIKQSSTALSTIANPNASDSQKAAATASAIAGATTTSFTGSTQAPQSIKGQEVIGTEDLGGGEVGFRLSNGDVVPRTELTNSSNVASSIQAFSVLNSNASDEDKALALGAVGVNAAAANDIIAQTAAGNSLAGLSLFNTATDWGNMSPLQQAASAIQTTSSVFAATSQALGQTAAGTGVSALNFASAGTTSAAAGSAGAGAGVTVGGALGAAALGAGAVLGVHTAATTFAAIEDMSQSRAVKKGAGGGALAGAAIGAGFGPLGAVIGAVGGALAGVVAGSTGTGKNSGQIARDDWRDGLKKAGIVDKSGENKEKVELANGEFYDIGRDGGAKLQNVGTNVDGRNERFTFDVDWSNEVAVNSIPDAHVFAIATGLDPTTGTDFDIFHRASTQALNAATSNASDKEAVQANFKHMLEKAEVDPRQVGMRLEILRATEKITDQEYRVYLDSTNGMFGTQLAPTGKEEGFNLLLSSLQNRGQLPDGEKDLLALLTNQSELDKSQRERQKRIESDARNQ